MVIQMHFYEECMQHCITSSNDAYMVELGPSGCGNEVSLMKVCRSSIEQDADADKPNHKP